jgi:hypothetical protein
MVLRSVQQAGHPPLLDFAHDVDGSSRQTDGRYGPGSLALATLRAHPLTAAQRLRCR